MQGSPECAEGSETECFDIQDRIFFPAVVVRALSDKKNFKSPFFSYGLPVVSYHGILTKLGHMPY